MPVKFHDQEKHSLEPILVAEEMDLNMGFTDWNKLVGEKRKQLLIAQSLGSIVLERLDQEDLDMLYKLFPEHYSELVVIMSYDRQVND